ncbi:hypothetical protein CI109_100507 [Kwoniella shandongensis]|uniref:Uncharacterized protein n=1 Tax=Kwoniella shandongensis TaxID=1734106 RepID=A0A5M6C4N6_9TREE|nr:uncharacterized protein CI109_001649 [Kwoniella shandongensis]KAA5529710.1 hypothetical protein CI109_001649 [Kwoniella shandongensis]
MSGTIYRGPINPNPKEDEARIVIYGYIPSLALGLVGIITFILVACAHTFWLVRKKRTRTFHILILIGALMEIGGYGARLASHKRPFVVGSFIGQYFLIVVAPVLFTAAIYLSLTLAVNNFDGAGNLLVISPKKVLAFFITADVLTTILQIIGAALIGSSESARVQGKESFVTPEQANDILLAGLAIQCFSFLCFLAVLIIAISRTYRQRTTLQVGNEDQYRDLKKLLWVILITSLLILLRTSFRLAETAQGFFGYASTHESLFGTLEYLPVILALTVWAIAPPSKFLGTHRGVSGTTELGRTTEKARR